MGSRKRASTVVERSEDLALNGLPPRFISVGPDQGLLHSGLAFTVERAETKPLSDLTIQRIDTGQGIVQIHADPDTHEVLFPVQMPIR